MIPLIFDFFRVLDNNKYESSLKQQIFSHVSSFIYFNNIEQKSGDEVLQIIFRAFEDSVNNLNLSIDSNCINSINIDENIQTYLKFHIIIHNYEHDIDSIPVDKFGRTIESVKCRYKIKLNSKPYLDILIGRIFSLFANVKFIKKTHVLMTHDIDKIKYLPDFKGLIRSLIGDLIKRRFFTFARIWDYFFFKNAHSNLVWLYRNQGSHIFLFLNNKSYLNSDYEFPDDLTEQLVELKKLNVYFGFHYSLNASNDENIMKYEFENINSALGRVNFVRGHYLCRTAISDSFIINNKLIDLTPYSAEEGFIYFTGLPFLLSTKFGLKRVLPTHSMDVSFELNTKITDAEKIDGFLKPYYDSFGASFFVFNWHNTSRRWGTWIKSNFNYQKVCQKLGL